MCGQGADYCLNLWLPKCFCGWLFRLKGILDGIFSQRSSTSATFYMEQLSRPFSDRHDGKMPGYFNSFLLENPLPSHIHQKKNKKKRPAASNILETCSLNHWADQSFFITDALIYWWGANVRISSAVTSSDSLKDWMTYKCIFPHCAFNSFSEIVPCSFLKNRLKIEKKKTNHLANKTRSRDNGACGLVHICHSWDQKKKVYSILTAHCCWSVLRDDSPK